MVIRYLAALDVIAIHTAVMERYKSGAGIRDQGLLEGAVMRPQMAAHYEEADLVEQAALLIEAVARAHAFIDGNKRTALAVGVAFLHINGMYIECAPTEFGQQILGVVERTHTLVAFTAWMRERMQTRE